MATMLNIVPVETKQNTILQKANRQGSNKGDKQSVGFSKMLTKETDKKELADAVDGKENVAAQLMAAMAGIVVLPTPVNTAIVNESGNPDTADVVPVETEMQLPNLVKELQVDTDLVTNLKTSQSQLETVLSKMPGIKELTNGVNNSEPSVVEPIFVEPIGMDFTQVQKQSVDKQENMQIDPPSPQAVDISLKEASQLANVVPSMVMDSTNKMEKHNNKQQIDNKKTTASQMNGGVITKADFTELIGEEVKTVIAPQPVLNVADSRVPTNNSMDQLVLNTKEQANPEGVLSEETVSNSDVFSNLLTQQVVKNEHHVTLSDIKPVQQQPITDPYHVTSQIVDQARLIEGQKNTEMIIRLKPEHLGELTFKVTIENGVVSASFHSNNTEVRNILEASLVQLKQELANQGLKVENVGIYAGLGEFFSNGQRESQKKPEVKVQNRKIEEDFLETLESNNLAEAVSDVSGVDYRV